MVQRHEVFARNWVFLLLVRNQTGEGDCRLGSSLPGAAPEDFSVASARLFKNRRDSLLNEGEHLSERIERAQFALSIGAGIRIDKPDAL